MTASSRSSRPMLYVGLLAVLMSAMLALLVLPPAQAVKAKGTRRSSVVQAAVVQAVPSGPVSVPAAQANGFTPQVRLGYTAGDQWEPAIAADRFGHVYVLYPQYLGVPDCGTCPSPTMILVTSADRGRTWAAPRQIAPPGSGQWDAQIVVDPVDGRTVYASWLQNGKSDTVVAKSTDFGTTWNVVVANRTNAGTDKPLLAVRGPHVYVAYNHAQKIWVSSSHDGGATFTSVNVNKTGKLGWALASGAVVDTAGTVYIGWAGYEQNGGARGKVNLFVSRSTDGGATWTNTVLDISGAPPDCASAFCGWAYLGAQVALAADSANTVYALWNAGAADKSPERMYFARTADGVTWTRREEVSTAPAGAHHAFPAIDAGAAGDVRISWMDARAPGGLWNTYYRSSTNGGASWSLEVDLSTYVTGYSYIHPEGFNFPFGDYYELDVDDRGNSHVVWGEALNYDTPGSIWYATGR